ncbi:hypothetical protein AA13594_0375 [Gluconacetobacter azotocaptans DSM 13594]|nr:hypothetical protein AA13594_0375 [Gluconacetobacter azotocaptans DSM 13594]
MANQVYIVLSLANRLYGGPERNRPLQVNTTGGKPTIGGGGQPLAHRFITGFSTISLRLTWFQSLAEPFQEPEKLYLPERRAPFDIHCNL